MSTERPKVELDEEYPASLPLLESIADLLDIEEAYHAVKVVADGKGDAPVVFRKAVKAALDLLCEHTILDRTTDLIQLRSEVTAISTKLDSVLEERSRSELEQFLLPGTLSERFHSDHAAAKLLVSQYVLNKFLSEQKPIRWFIQGSVTAIHLARALARKRFAVGSLVHTNSIVLPLLILSDHTDIDVRPFSGSLYDPACGGWLPRPDDDEAYDHLRGLFQRPNDPLTDSIITPMAATANGTLYFTRAELIKLVDELSQLSRHLIFMTFDSRVYADSRSMNGSLELKNVPLLPFELKNLSPDVRAELVVSADVENPMDANQAATFIDSLTTAGFVVHWQRADGWNVHPGKQAADA
jgi:hypothetical protein